MDWEAHKKILLKDSKFKKTLKETHLEYEIARTIILMRLKRKMTQKELAKRLKTKQSVISRLESGTANPSLSFLKRLAKALDSRLEIRLVSK